MVIFHSYVSLPEGINFLNDGWTLALKFRKPWVFFLPSNIREKSHDNRYQMLPTNMGFYHCCTDQFRHPITGQVIVTSWFLMFLCKHPRQLISKKHMELVGWVKTLKHLKLVGYQIIRGLRRLRPRLADITPRAWCPWSLKPPSISSHDSPVSETGCFPTP